MTQASQAQGQVWAAMSTQVNQTFGPSSELHMGAVDWVVDTGSFDRTGQSTITNQGYASAAHEDSTCQPSPPKAPAERRGQRHTPDRAGVPLQDCHGLVGTDLFF